MSSDLQRELETISPKNDARCSQLGSIQALGLDLGLNQISPSGCPGSTRVINSTIPGGHRNPQQLPNSPSLLPRGGRMRESTWE